MSISSLFRAGARARRVATLAAFAAAVAAPLACSDSGPRTPVGSYTLASVNGKALPVTMFADTGFTIAIAGGSLDIQSSGRYIAGSTERWTIDGNLSTYVDADTGTWARQGDRITLVASDSSSQTASWDGTRITLVDSSGVAVVTMIYARR